MSEIVVRAEGLGKRYRLNAGRNDNTLRDRLNTAIMTPYYKLTNRSYERPHPQGVNSFWALEDVSFDLRSGEVLGVVGSNGSGKSTLLKILSRITRPTSGSAEIIGRLGSLLEVGAGFHPDLTGRENIFLNGSMLGMSRAEIARKLDQIIDFSEVEKFIDMPVKVYSSGMYIRLAFSVASHLESEIMLLDEVLQVGDIGFQEKSLKKMREIASDGRAVIIVSHSMASITALCHRAMWLRHGEIAQVGMPDEIIAAYSAYEFQANV